MQIPGVDRFGSDQPGAYQPASGSAAFQGAGQGAVGIGDAVGKIANDLRERQLVQQRADGALALAKITNGLHDAHDQIARGILDGTVQPEKAADMLAEKARDTVSGGMANLNDQQRAEIAAHAEGVVGTLNRNLVNAVAARKQSDTAATIDQFGEQVARQAPQQGPGWASQKYGDMIDFAGPAAGMTPAQIAKKKQAFTESTHYVFFDAAGTDALTRMDEGAVRAVRERVQSPEGDALDPLKRTQLTHTLFGYEQHIIAVKQREANAAEAERVRRENLANEFFNQASDIILKGGTPAPEWIKQANAAAAAAGPQFQADLSALMEQQARFGGFATMPASKRAAMLEDMRADRTRPGVGATPQTEKLLTMATAIDAKLREQAKDNPWEAAQTAGAIPNAPLIDMSNPDAALQAVGQRMASIGAVEAWTEQKVSPLQPREAEQVQRAVRSLPPDQAASFLGRLGAMVGDSDRAAALAKQIGDKDGTAGLAMAFANQQTTEGRYTAELVLRGERALKDKTAKPDETALTGWKATIANAIRGAYPAQDLEDQVVHAAYLINAARAAEGKDDLPNAIRLATGGGIVDFNGAKVPMPAGYSTDGQSSAEDRFRKAISSIPPEQLMPQVPDGRVYFGGPSVRASDFLASLKDAQLMLAGPGAYYVRAGNGFAKNVNGQRIVVSVPR